MTEKVYIIILSIVLVVSACIILAEVAETALNPIAAAVTISLTFVAGYIIGLISSK